MAVGVISARELRLRQRIDTLQDRVEEADALRQQLADVRAIKEAQRRRINALEVRLRHTEERLDAWILIANRATSRLAKRAASA